MAGIVYIHVPKCGGSSFGAALRLRFLWSSHAIKPQDQDFTMRREELAQSLRRGTKLITGHVPYCPQLHQEWGQDHRFVTLMRDPVERFVSHYQYLQRKHPSPKRPDTLEAFLDTPDAVRLGMQYLVYFSGANPDAPSPEGGAIRQAIVNLTRFSLVGDLAQPEAFARGLSGLVGTPLPRLHRNRAPMPTKVPSHLVRRIEHLCAPDISIYQAFHGLRCAC